MDRQCVCCNNYVNFDSSVITICMNYVCPICLNFRKLRNNYKGMIIICCMQCISKISILRNNVDRLIFIKKFRYNDITIYKYEIYRTEIFSIIDIYQQEKEVYGELKIKMLRQLDDFIIKDLLDIVMEYVF